MDVIFFDIEPTETERKILALRTKLVNFQGHFFTAKTKRDERIAMERIRAIQAEIYAITYNEDDDDECLLLEEN